MAVEALPLIWDRLPEPMQKRISGSDLHKFLQRQVAYREPLAELEIAPTDDYSFTMLVPDRLSPWWLDYDPAVSQSCHEPITTRTFVEEISISDVVWDMGSQWGYFAVLAADLNESPTDVHVFDMEPYHNLQIERTSDALYGDNGLNVVQTFISDSSGPDRASGDHYATKNGPPDFVKIDIEGAEADAIAGMTDIIESNHPTLVIEVHPNKIEQGFNKDVSEMIEYIDDQYNVIEYCENFRDRDSSWKELDPNDPPSPGQKGMDGGVDKDSYQLFCR